MPQIQVKKVVAVCFLEAVKLCLDQLGAFRLELSQQGVPGSPDVARYYGEVRRLRDYLQRCVSAYPDHVTLDIAASDAALLVACCRRSVEVADVRLSEQALANDERQWLQRKRQVLADWAVELAEKPLMELPLKRLSSTIGEATRGLTTRLQNKVFGDVRDRPKIVAPTSTTSIMTGLQSFGEQIAALDEPGRPQLPAAGTVAVDPAPSPATPPPSTPQPPPPPVAPPKPAAVAAPQAPVTCSVVFDHLRLRDPRLRSLVGIDLRNFERIVATGDYRLATVLLASLVEAAVLDHVIPRRAEFGLTGTPDTWNTQDLLIKVMGGRGTPQDLSLAYHLFSARNLLRPALQIVNPAIVTMSSFERMRELVQRALQVLGFAPATNEAMARPVADG
jgi:hypothetical protein